MDFYPKPQNALQNGASTTPWWSRGDRDGLSDRVKQINKINDPNVYSDNVLRAAKVILLALLFFTGALGALSYFKNFSLSFHPYVAMALALTLTFVIEWGKNAAGKWAIRIPMFQGWRHISDTPANTVIWAGLLLIAAATFTMSIFNSTKGGEQLSLMLSQERNAKAFQPNTSDIDSLIEATQRTIDNAPMAKWNGKMYYQDAKTVRAAQQTITKLHEQRSTTLSQQRSDFERIQAQESNQSNFAASLVLASGGWVECLQILLIILCVACEKALDRYSTGSPQEQKQSSIGFKRNEQPVMAEETKGKPIGFNVNSDGNVRSASKESAKPIENAVAQLQHTVPQNNGGMNTLGSDFILKGVQAKLQSEIPGFKRKDASPGSVSRRINEKLDEALEAMRATGFSPTRATGIQVYQYLQDKAFPEINAVGWPYDKEDTFISLLRKAIPDA